MKMTIDSPSLHQHSQERNSRIISCHYAKEALPVIAKSANETATRSFEMSTDDPVSKIENQSCGE